MTHGLPNPEIDTDWPADIECILKRLIPDSDGISRAVRDRITARFGVGSKQHFDGAADAYLTEGKPKHSRAEYLAKAMRHWDKIVRRVNDGEDHEAAAACCTLLILQLSENERAEKLKADHGQCDKGPCILNEQPKDMFQQGGGQC